jgi:hypothetical protein
MATTAAEPNYSVVPIDYTSRDYSSLREDLIARVKDRVPEWEGSDPSDFGIALIEAVAHAADMLCYYADRIAAESFIATATQRENVLQHARELGYQPAGYRPAYAQMQVHNDSGASVTLPAGSRVVAQVVTGNGTTSQNYETQAELTIAPSATEPVWIRHGQTVNETLGVSDGLPNQSFRVFDFPIVEDSVVVAVDGARWSTVRDILDYGPSDPVVRVFDNGAGVASAVFGDGVSGAVPAINADIDAQYVIGGGTVGNMPANTALQLAYVPDANYAESVAIDTALTLSLVDAAAGGTDPEDTNLIRYAAPLVGRVRNRAVTLDDYTAIALAVPGVGAAATHADDVVNVTTYVAPYRGSNHADVYPGGKDTTTAEYTALLAATQIYVAERSLLGTGVTVDRATYADVELAMTVYILPRFLADEVEQAVRDTMLSVFGYSNMDLDMTIKAQNIEYVVSQVRGVSSAHVTDLRHEFTGDEGWLSCDGFTLPGQPNALWIFTEAGLDLTLTGGVVV